MASISRPGSAFFENTPATPHAETSASRPASFRPVTTMTMASGARARRPDTPSTGSAPGIDRSTRQKSGPDSAAAQAAG
ncbi:MAG: hypothetical protein DI570_20665 [Phenylobacterium zucineum]|nr:MAG: hypothetical protein DI570_20665 [Phenylobacterium zucineum]